MSDTPTLLNTPPRRNQLDVLEDIAASTAALAEGESGAGGPDREVVTETYRANKAFTGASLNDLITSTRVVDVSGTAPTIVGTPLWYNETTRAVLASAPLAADITLAAGGGGATNGELVAALATQTGVKITAATLAAGGSGILGWLSNLLQFFTERSDTTALNVNTVKQPTVARQLPAGAASAATQLTAAARRISIHAHTADIRYLLGSATGTALATSHFIAVGERLDLALPATPWLMVIRAGDTDGVLEVSELT